MGEKPWVTNVYKPLNMTGIRGFPLLDKCSKWLLKYTGNNVIIAEEHISSLNHVLGVNSIPNEKEDVVMKLLSLSLEENVKSW